MLYNLARLHSTNENFDDVYAMIKRSYITHHVSSYPRTLCCSLITHSGIRLGDGRLQLRRFCLLWARPVPLFISTSCETCSRFPLPHCWRSRFCTYYHLNNQSIVHANILLKANHAWIVGSLESAYRGVWNFLERFHCYDLQHKMVKEFGTIPELEMGKHGFAHLLVLLGMLTPQQLAKPEKTVVNDVMS